jgi:hypothetical protein
MGNCPVCGKPGKIHVVCVVECGCDLSDLPAKNPKRSLLEIWTEDIRHHPVRHAVLFFLGLTAGLLIIRMCT